MVEKGVWTRKKITPFIDFKVDNFDTGQQECDRRL